MLVALTAIPYGSVEPWWESVFECAVFAIGVLWVIQGLLTGVLRLGEHRLLVPLLALVVFAFIQILPLWTTTSFNASNGSVLHTTISADSYATRLAAMKLLSLALALGLLLRYTSSQRRLRVLTGLIIGVSVVSALFGLIRQMTQVAAPSFVLPYLSPGIGYGQFINPNHFALLMEMGLGLVLGLVVGRGVRYPRLLIYLGAGFIVWLALVLSSSRGGIFSTFSQFLFLSLLVPVTLSSREFPRWTDKPLGRLWRAASSLAFRVILIMFLGVALAIGTVWVGGDPLADRLEDSMSDFKTEGPARRDGNRRIDFWRATWPLIKTNLIAGVGFGGYWIAVTKYHDASGEWVPQQAHNDYLELLASGGFIGAALGAWFVFELVKRAQARLKSSDPFRRAACLGALAGMFGVATHSLVDFGLHITINALIFICLVVVITVDIPVEERDDMMMDPAKVGHLEF